MIQPDPSEERLLLGECRVAERQRDHEPIELGLRQRKGAFELNGILGRKDQKRFRQLTGVSIDRHLALGHRFEQRSLGPRCRPIYLVGQEDVGEDWPRLESERAASGIKHSHPRYIVGQEVRRALKASELDSHRRRETAGEHCLAGARHIVDEDVATTEHGDGDLFDLGSLTDDDLADTVHDQANGVGERKVHEPHVSRARIEKSLLAARPI
jgi:hypothetical protein